MADEVDEVRARIDIVDLVESTGVALRKTGRNFLGLCPFHPDRKPSLTVTPLTGRYKCFACGEGGDIFNWVMKTQNVDFPEALRRLAERAGVTLSRRNAAESAVARSETETQRKMMEAALAFFRSELSKSTTAKEYCERRSLDAATLKTWEIGYAPDVGEALVALLKREGFSLATAKELFLVDGDSSRGYGDKFRGRIIFAIRDERGHVVAFGGRVLGDALPKYINSADTPLYRKSRVVFGLWQARDRMRLTRNAILTEGYLDTIACHQAGLSEAVASLGTSLTEEQAKLLKRWADVATILYDGDDAGLKAADRAATILGDAGLVVKIAMLPPGQDPDTLLRSNGPQALKEVVDAAVSPLDFRIAVLERTVKPSDPAFWNEAYALLATAPNELEMMRHVERLAPQYPGVSDVIAARKALRSEALRRKRAGKRNSLEPSLPTIASVAVRSVDSAELALLHAYLSLPDREELHAYMTDPSLFTTETGRQISAAVLDAFPASAPDGPPATWLANLGDVADVIGELNLGRVGTVNKRYVEDSIERLKRKRLDREHRARETADGRLRQTQERLEKVKTPDPRDHPDRES